VFECVVNISEGRDVAVLEQLSRAAGSSLRDRHRDRHHHRSVFTLINEPEALLSDLHTLANTAYQRVDLRRHQGVHPRFGVLDVVPFVALAPEDPAAACALRDETADWFADTQAVPVFLYGPLSDGSVRTLPEVRRGAFDTLAPDRGPDDASPSRGAVAVGCRPLLVAWNLWLRDVTMDQAREMAVAVRGPAVRALAFEVGDEVQVSCNLIDVEGARTSAIYDVVSERLGPAGQIERAELVGLAPKSLLEAEDESRWEELGLSLDTTIEARLAI
jgi:glutamate formiminotransferase / 5-formyltetrahydrofolate cyclo-ligase